MRNERVWNLIGMIASVLVIALGVVMIAAPGLMAVTGTADSYDSAARYSGAAYSSRADEYTTGSYPSWASFGADYYTYEYNATRQSASNAATISENQMVQGNAMAEHFETLDKSMAADFQKMNKAVNDNFGVLDNNLGRGLDSLILSMFRCFGLVITVAGLFVFLGYTKKFALAPKAVKAIEQLPAEPAEESVLYETTEENAEEYAEEYAACEAAQEG